MSIEPGVMTIQAIMQLAADHAIAQTSTPIARMRINDCIMDIANYCPRTGRVIDTFTVEDALKKAWYPLPKNLLDIYSVENSKGSTSNYTVANGSIRFLEDDTYIITYKRAARRIVNDSEVIELPLAFGPAIALYIAAREKYNFNPDDIDGSRLMAEYRVLIRELERNLFKRRTRYIKAPIW